MKKKILIALAIVILIPIGGIVALVAVRETPDGPRSPIEGGIVGVEAGGAYAGSCGLGTAPCWSMRGSMPRGLPFSLS